MKVIAPKIKPGDLIFKIIFFKIQDKSDITAWNSAYT